MSDPSTNSRPSRALIAIALLLGLGVGIGATLLLRGDQAPDRTPVSTSGTTRDGDPEAAAELPPIDEGITLADASDPETALRGFLAAEATGDWETSYTYLTAPVTEVVFPTPAAWVAAHADFPGVVGYRIDEVSTDEEAGTATISTLTGFDPVLDPVIGLVAARGRTVWSLVRGEDDLWRVDSQATENQPLYPGSAGSEQAVRDWVDTRAACQDATELERGLIGTPTLADKLCEEDQDLPVAIGPVGALADSADVAPLLSEFGPAVFAWARTARVEAATPLVAVLAPIGSEWRVVAILPAR